ncbi:MAG: transposase, partial [Desulfobacterales bacterium]|nr:transposase [Desulfobacterales bacterium]
MLLEGLENAIRKADNTAMRRSFTYRLYPTRRQERALLAQLEVCRMTWNILMEDHRAARGDGLKPPSRFSQMKLLTEVKTLYPELGLQGVNAQVIQNVAVRVNLAMMAYFRRVGTGEKPGYPRFKESGRCDSMTFPQAPKRGCHLDEQGRLYIDKIGCVKAKQHRPLRGTMKTATVRRSPTGKWYVAFSCDGVPLTHLPESGKAVGIDLGVREFASFSDGTFIHNPRHLDGDVKDLKRAQRKKSKAEKGSLERAFRIRIEARISERVANRRADFTDKLAKEVVEEYGTVIVEDLNPGRMGRDRRERRNIRDAAWGMFVRKLESKAEEAGNRVVVKVNPAY